MIELPGERLRQRVIRIVLELSSRSTAEGRLPLPRHIIVVGSVVAHLGREFLLLGLYDTLPDGIVIVQQRFRARVAEAVVLSEYSAGRIELGVSSVRSFTRRAMAHYQCVREIVALVEFVIDAGREVDRKS